MSPNYCEPSPLTNVNFLQKNEVHLVIKFHKIISLETLINERMSSKDEAGLNWKNSFASFYDESSRAWLCLRLFVQNQLSFCLNIMMTDLSAAFRADKSEENFVTSLNDWFILGFITLDTKSLSVLQLVRFFSHEFGHLLGKVKVFRRMFVDCAGSRCFVTVSVWW